MHEQWQDRLSEYLDDELNATDKRELEAHLAGCDDCRTTLAELRHVVAAARTIEDRAPAQELWPNIAAAIAGAATRDVVPLRPPQSRRFSFTAPQLAAAAVLLMALSGAGVWYVTQTSSADDVVSGTIVHTSSAPASNVLVSAQPATDPTFAATVAELEETLAEQRASLDPATVEIIERSLNTIDAAMAEARTALSADPGNLYLHRQLESTMQKKIDVLRRVTRLARAGT